MRIIVLTFLLALAASQAPAQTVHCSSSERFGGTLIKVGDSERRVIEQEPDREVRLETREGGTAGYRFDFYKHGRTVQVYTSAGVVVRVCRIREF
jgi:hypothetical protein